MGSFLGISQVEVSLRFEHWVEESAGSIDFRQRQGTPYDCPTRDLASTRPASYSKRQLNPRKMPDEEGTRLDAITQFKDTSSYNVRDPRWVSSGMYDVGVMRLVYMRCFIGS